MASLSEIYFASLDECFSGDIQLISWESAFLRLSNTREDLREYDSLYKFLTSPDSINILSNPFCPFAKPSPTTKTHFESKTAAINVASTSQARYDLDEIKDDTLWVSRQAQIDEVSALRIVVLEWQNRPNSQLLSRFSEEEITSLEEVARINRLSRPVGEIQAIKLPKYAGAQSEDASTSPQESRRLRLFHLCLTEKLHILKVSRRLLSAALRRKLPSNYDLPGPERQPRRLGENTKLEELGKSIFGIRERAGTPQGHTSAEECIKAIQLRIENLESGNFWFTSDGLEVEIAHTWYENALEELAQILQVLFLQIQLSGVIPSPKLLLSWLRLMAKYEFLEGFVPSTEEHLALFTLLQALISVTTLAFLKLPESLSYFDQVASQQREVPEIDTGSLPFFMSRENIGEINELFLKTATSGLLVPSPAVFAWGMIMYSVRELARVTKEERELQQVQNAVDSFKTNALTSSPSRIPEQSIYEDILEGARNPAFDDDFVMKLVTAAVDKCRLFDFIIALTNEVESISDVGDGGLTSRWIRVELLDLVRASIAFLDYIPEVVSAVLCIIAGPNNVWSWGADKRSNDICDPRDIFVDDPVLMNKIFRIAKSRFPYEAVNFLKICRILSGCSIVDGDGLPFIARELECMDTYTQVVLPGFQGYEPVREEENANFVNLIQPLEMREVNVLDGVSGRASRGGSLITTESLMLPPATIGQVVSESKPAVIMWHHDYNCLSFLGRWLEHATEPRSYGSEPGDDESAEIVGLFADLITSAQAAAKHTGTDSTARRILEMASDGLIGHGDIISVVFDIFERNLQGTNSRAGSNRYLDSTISCLYFTTTLVTLLPGRVWPFLSRSSFLGGDAKGGALAAIVSALEASSGDYSFLLAAIRLFQAVVDDAVTHAAIRMTLGNVSSKSDHVPEFSASVPLYVMRNFLLDLVRAMVEIYNCNASWRYNNLEQKFEINTALTTTFDNILYYAYGIDDSSDLDSKLTGVFSSSAPYILNILRPAEALSFNPVLHIILDGLRTPTSSADLRALFLRTRQVESALRLLERLIQVGSLIKSPISPLENQLFNASPVLVRLYALHFGYQLPVATLLELLVSRAASDPDHEPPSLLGHLGAESSCRFLDALAKFDRPFEEPTLNIAIWRLLSSIVSKRQQWLAVFLLTGSSPRESLKEETKREAPSMRGHPFLGTSLDLLSTIHKISPRVAISALDFVARAQENWPWTTSELKKHPRYFQNILGFVANLDMRTYSVIDQCLNTKIAALVADICAIYLHSAKEARDRTFFKTLIPLVGWFSKNAVEVDGYNASLHSNLKKNFEMKYPGCKLLGFKRTPLGHAELGSDYFYDLSMGRKLFGYDFAWAGSANQSFAAEIERANFNLSLVEAQMALLHSWKFFAMEHCVDFMPDREVQKSMARVVRDCLISNSRNIPSEQIFSRLQQVRAEFALGLLQRLVEVRSRGTDVFRLLGVAWDATRSRFPTYESALLNDDTEYYGSLLNIIFLSLQFHVASPSRAAPEAISKKPEVSSDLEIVLDIIKCVVAQGFRSLTTYLLDEPQKCSPKHFATLNVILQTSLRVKDADRIYEQLAYSLAENDAIRYATTLFSWSYRFTVEGDPIYGELSILFLLELSCVPMMAEQMAVEGVLMKLSTYQLTEILRQPQGYGPFEPIPRLFSIWQAGILPLCLNLLYHVSRAAPEVAAFLNQFEGQLRRASEAFSSSHPTTISSSFATGHSTLASSPPLKRISLSIASEASSLALISMILQKFRDAGPSAGVDAQHVQQLKWDKEKVKDDVEALLEKRTLLRARITATNEKELLMAHQEPTHPSSGSENLLEEKIVKELRTAVMCMGSGEGA